MKTTDNVGHLICSMSADDLRHIIVLADKQLRRKIDEQINVIPKSVMEKLSEKKGSHYSDNDLDIEISVKIDIGVDLCLDDYEDVSVEWDAYEEHDIMAEAVNNHPAVIAKKKKLIKQRRELKKQVARVAKQYKVEEHFIWESI